jgi:hypothetical protein
MHGVVGLAATHPDAFASGAPGMHRSAPLQNTPSEQSPSFVHRTGPVSFPSPRVSLYPSVTTVSVGASRVASPRASAAASGLIVPLHARSNDVARTKAEVRSEAVPRWVEVMRAR